MCKSKQRDVDVCVVEMVESNSLKKKWWEESSLGLIEPLVELENLRDRAAELQRRPRLSQSGWGCPAHCASPPNAPSPATPSSEGQNNCDFCICCLACLFLETSDLSFPLSVCNAGTSVTAVVVRSECELKLQRISLKQPCSLAKLV